VHVILGIGNPGNKYNNNRHNIGFRLLDYFASKNLLSFVPSKESFYYCQGKLDNFEYYLIKPTTYVNNSGIAAMELMETLNIRISDLLVVHDDINLNIGALKVKLSGGDGGHNGVNSIIYHLNSNEFTRLRIGAGNNFGKGEMAEYVLSDFNPDEEKILETVFDTGNYLIGEFIKGGTKQILDASSILAGKSKRTGKAPENDEKLP
jgi:peptidyl-tRNA hydrolase, PTH1 family